MASPATAHDPAALVAELRAFLTRTGLGYSDLARATGFAIASVHDVARGKKAAGAELAGALTRFMATYRAGEPIERDRSLAVVTPTPSEDRAAEPDGFRMTRAATVVHRALDYCARRHLNGALFGDPGVGKSMALRHWSATTRYPHAIVFCRAYTGYISLMAAIGRALGLGGNGRVRDLDDQIHEDLLRRPRLVVVDEADFLDARPLDWLRSIWDESDRRSSFVLVGKPAFYARLQTAHGRSKHDLRQVWRRLAFRKFLDGIDRAEMVDALDARGLGGRVDTEAVDALCEATGGSYGELDMLVELLAEMLDENAKLGGRVTAALVAKAAELRFGAGWGRARRRA